MSSTARASSALASGTSTPRRPRSLASIAAESTPRTERTPPSRPSSPSTSKSATASEWSPLATRTASAIGRSSAQPGLRRSAGARLTVTFLSGRSVPTLSSAARMRTVPSLTEVAARPTTL